jgi:hypothetical protein
MGKLLDFKKLTSFFTIASGIFAVIPGITVLISNVGVPPGASSTLFAATIEALGVLMLLILWLNKKWINNLTMEKTTRLAIVGAIIFLVALFSYLFLFGYYVEDVPDSNALFFPFWPQGELKENLVSMGSRAELIRQWGRDDVYNVIQSSSKSALLMTTLIFLFVYQLIFLALTFSFGILGIKAN